MPNVDLSRAVECFFRQMTADGRTPASVESYRRELTPLVKALKRTPIRSVSADQLNRYLTSSPVQLRSDGTPKRTSTINRVKSVIRAFFGWCERTGRSLASPAAHVRLGVISLPTPGHMTEREVARFLGTIERAGHSLSSRDHALFATLAYTGIRLSDAVSLRRRDIRLRRR